MRSLNISKVLVLSIIVKDNCGHSFAKEEFTMLTIDKIKEKIVPIAQKHGVKAIHLFGSYARMEATTNNDLDLLIEPGKIETFTQMARFLEDLEESITKKIDILTIEQLNDSHILKEEINKDRILIYRK